MLFECRSIGFEFNVSIVLDFILGQLFFLTIVMVLVKIGGLAGLFEILLDVYALLRVVVDLIVEAVVDCLYIFQRIKELINI